MASAKKSPRAGYEPAKGFPDPEVEKVNLTGVETHYPQTNGTICGKFPVPTDAGAYDSVSPTCPKCSKWLNAARAQTAARHPWAKQGGDGE